MTRIAPGRIVAAARADLGKPAPENTCWSHGGNKWPQDVGLPGIGTNSTTEARLLAKAGHHGWSYHEGMDGVREGDFLDWAGEGIWHTSIVEDIDEQGRIRSIGAGGPTGEVWWQPRSQGYNPRSTFRGYFRPPTEDGKDPKTQPIKTPAKPAAKPSRAPVKVKGAKYTVKHGDNLWTIAKRNKTSTTAIVRRNRPLIRDPRHIEAGWVLTLP